MERIFVAVRARPLASEESSPWRISGDSIFLPNSATKFDFDRVFGEDSKTVDIFEARTKDIVASVVCGFNGTVFAYGQTSSGKTYTMRGSANEPGIIPLSVLELFYSIHEKMDREFLVRVSYMEIYNEEINDLLAPEHLKLQIHESLERGIYVTGLKEEIVNSPEQVLGLVEFGESHRHIGETNMNLYSSRSHTIFRMIVESRERGEEGDSNSYCGAVRVSVLVSDADLMNLVDLAGSERAVKTGADGTRLKEGSHINKSLLTLGTVIKKLSEGAESQGGHVPYRDSKLTRILQPALGGNANTAIICNVTLSQIHADETKCSLLFASRALQVKNCACVNEILTDAALLKRQKKEIEELRAKLLSCRSEHLEEEVLNLRNTLLHSELEKERIALELKEEKKDKAHRERKLLEQAKKIENLSSLILCTERDDRINHSIKLKRRLTWCPGPFLQKLSDELDADIMDVGDEETELLHPSSSIVQECEKLADNIPIIADCVDKGFSLPDARALLNVTSRRKIRQNCANITMEGGQLVEQLIEFADLFFQDDAKEDANNARDEVRISLEQKTDGDKVFKLSLSNGEITSHFGHFRQSYNDVFTIMEECFQFLSILSEKVESFKMLSRLCLAQLKFIISGHESISNFFTKKYKEVEVEKELLSVRLYDYQNQICELLSNLENKEKIAVEQVLCHDMEKNELLSQVLHLKKEVSQLSSCSLKWEMEALKNELDKSKSKLKDAECKLKSIIQEKVKLEGEKAQAEREIKNLQGQRAFLEREVLKQDSLLDSRRESKSDFKLNGNERFEIIAFELEAEISSLKEALEITIYEKEEASVKNEALNLESEDVANKLNIAYFEMELLKENLERMEKRLADSEYSSKILEDSLKLLLKEKEDMILKLTEALLEVEAEKSSWTFKEKSLCEKLNISNNEIFKLLASLSKVHNELNLCKDQCNGFKEKLYLSEENFKRKDPSMTKFSDSGELTEESNIKDGNEDLLLSHSYTTSIEIDNVRTNILKVTTERDNLLTEVEQLRWLHVKLDTFEGKYDDLKSNAEFCLQELNQRISSFEVDIKKADFGNIEELGDLRKKLNSTEVELESCHRRLMESLNEKKKMDVKYREAADMLKNELRTCGQIILDLMNRLSEKT